MASLGTKRNVLGGVYKAVASGSIANGKPCKINSDGTVSQGGPVAGGKLYIGAVNYIYEFKLETPFTTSSVAVPEASGSWGSMGTALSSGNDYARPLNFVNSQETGMHSMTFNSDGTKFFTCGYSGKDINEYTLSTAYDLGTTSFVDSYAVNSQLTGNPYGLDFKTDGTEMYVTDSATSNVQQYTLSTGFDVSTASHTRTFDTSRDDTGHGIRFKPDGTKMYVVSGVSDRTDQFSLSTAWNISTASFDSVSLDHSSNNTAPEDLVFNDDGTKLIVIGSNTFEILEYTLSTAYDLSTASFSSENYIHGAYYHSIAFSPGGSINNDNYIGISQGSYTNGQTASIKVIGAIDTNQSGLTPNALCYVTDAGSITSTSTGIIAGQALTPTTVLIKNQYDMLFD